MPRAPSTAAPAAESRPAASRLRVAVAGAGPGGLGCAIGLARQGHEVHVFERLDAPAVRGLVSRERSYPVAVEARGMRALERLGAAGPHSAVRRHMPQRQDFHFDALIGSRDALVQGLLEHIEESQPTWPGSVHIYHCCGVAGVDLRRRTLEFAPGAAAPGVEAAARAAPFDLICACDGRNSPVRESAVLQVADLQVSHHEDWTRYKTVTLDQPRGLAPGRMHFLDGVHVAVLPDGTAVGRIGMKGAGKGSGAGQLRRMGLTSLMPYVSPERRPPSTRAASTPRAAARTPRAWSRAAASPSSATRPPPTSSPTGATGAPTTRWRWRRPWRRPSRPGAAPTWGRCCARGARPGCQTSSRMLGASSGGRRTPRPTVSCRRRARARGRGRAARASLTARVATVQARLTPTPRPSLAAESLSRTPGARRAGAKGPALAGRARAARARWTARAATVQALPTLTPRSSPANRISTRSPGARGAGAEGTAPRAGAPAGRARDKGKDKGKDDGKGWWGWWGWWGGS
ncbi:unnamed protein product [Prorocentrum cordatum]|uniref:FAD-binding domain-containing protein n=1 Tax=Prorocentrum cordatum TaxID=2364126 RepID=A0ABN9VVN9_9DINO|nr:unnamed protein product [Polarella glacialis]